MVSQDALGGDEADVRKTIMQTQQELTKEVSDRLRFPLESDTVIQKIADACRDAGDDPRKVREAARGGRRVAKEVLDGGDADSTETSSTEPEVPTPAESLEAWRPRPPPKPTGPAPAAARTNVVSDKEEAIRLKARGNEYYKDQDYENAYLYYSASLELEALSIRDTIACEANLTQTLLAAAPERDDAAQYYKFAEEHATKGILKFSGNQGEVSKTLGSKLYFRRGLALENLGRKREALADMQAAMELDDDRGIEKALLRLTRECGEIRPAASKAISPEARSLAAALREPAAPRGAEQAAPPKPAVREAAAGTPCVQCSAPKGGRFARSCGHGPFCDACRDRLDAAAVPLCRVCMAQPKMGPVLLQGWE